MIAPSSEAIGLCLNLLEAPTLRYTHATLVDFHGAAGKELIQLGFMVQCGHENSVDSEEDVGPVRVELSCDGQSLGFRSPSNAWLPVEQGALAIYRLDLDRLFAFLMGGELRPPAKGFQQADATGLVWDLGTARLSKRTSSVWFARRLSDPHAVANLAATAAARPSPDLRLLLTSTRRERFAAMQAPPMTIVVSIRDVLSHETGRIDFASLQARFEGRPVQSVSGPLHLSADNHVLTINGSVHLRLKGKIQREIVRRLVERHQRNQPIRATEILEEAKSNCKSLDQALGKCWGVLKGYLKPHGDGSWHFDF